MLRKLTKQQLVAIRPQGLLTHSSRLLSQYFTTGSGRDPSDEPAHSPRSSSWVDKQERHEKHWLDRVFPGSREWLEGQNRKWWFTNVAAISRKYPNLQGREQEITGLIEQSYQDFMRRHAEKGVDDRAQTHLQIGCLMLATDKVLQPFIRNRQEVLDIIKAQSGDQSSAFFSYLLRFSLFFTRDPFASSVRRLKALKLDLGKAFATNNVGMSDSSAQLDIYSCLYHSLFAEEGADQLLECCCCSQDVVWFDKLERHGVGFERTSWLGNGDKCCSLRLQQIKK